MNGSAYIPGVGSVPYQIQPTNPQNEASTRATVGAMCQVIQQSVNQPSVRAAAADALRLVGLYAPAWRKCQAIWEWIQRNISFVSDEEVLERHYRLPQDVELLQRPELLLLTGRGDCDCITMLTCSLLGLAAVPWRIVTIAADWREPWRFSHVYPIALDEAGNRIPMDASAALQGNWGARRWGWEAPVERVYRKVEWVA